MAGRQIALILRPRCGVGLLALLFLIACLGGGLQRGQIGGGGGDVRETRLRPQNVSQGVGVIGAGYKILDVRDGVGGIALVLLLGERRRLLLGDLLPLALQGGLTLGLAAAWAAGSTVVIASFCRVRKATYAAFWSLDICSMAVSSIRAFCRPTGSIATTSALCTTTPLATSTSLAETVSAPRRETEPKTR